MVSGNDFIANSQFQEEVFGSFSLIIKCKDLNEMEQVIKNLEANVPLIGPECAIPLQTPIDNLKAISETIKKWHLENPKNFG